MELTQTVTQGRMARLMSLGISGISCTPSERIKQLKSRLTANDLTRRRVEGLFSALGDETRLRMLELVAVEELCACEIMAALELTQPTTSHHLGILEGAGLLSSRRKGKWMFYKMANSRVQRIMSSGNDLARRPTLLPS